MDFNGDGLADVISGSYSPGYLYLFAKQADGTYAAGETIKDKEGKSIKVGYASHVYAADWDNDGDLDLVIGNIQGEVYYVENEGSRKENSFGKPQKLKVGDKELRVGHGDSGPILADWDGDGLLDLLVGGGDGSVSFHRNIGTKTEPRLAEAQVLISPGGWDGDGSRCGVRTKICVTDWNDDGRPDLLVGDFATVREPEPDLTDDQKAEREKAQTEYNAVLKEYQEAVAKTDLGKLYEQYSKLQEGPEDESAEATKEREKKVQELLKQISELQEKELKPYLDKLRALAPRLGNRGGSPHGFVWVFLRQPTAKPAAAN
ncbi:MAG: VCBS repeat-containing protein [Planctomycetes bacterium]|nr:VCBS repeat-containing protein [Planctomycetota bacterium]